MNRQILAGSGQNDIRRSTTWSRAVLAMFVTIVLGATAARAQTLDCINDVQGADDEPGQKDLNQFCDQLGDNTPFELTVKWNLDDTAWSGSNTGDACALFDTDGDHNANFALCVTVINGPPAVIKPGAPKLYSCSDTRPDRCVGSVAIASFTSSCSVGQGTDAFNHSGNICKNTPGCRTTDTVVTCRLESNDVPGTETCVNNRCSNIPSQFCLGAGDCIPLTDVCSYPSEQPNSDPSDCVITPTGQDPCQGVSCAAFSTQCATASCNPQNGQCDVFTPKPATTSCTGTSNGGACDGADHCSGTANTCVDVFQGAATTCRASAGACDVAESCSGTSGTCPADGFQPDTAGCTGASNGGACDGADHCSGSGNTCVDVFQGSTSTCRASAGACDVAEACSGTSGSCPADGFQPATVSCTGTSNGGACDGADHCSGSSNTCDDVFQGAATTCRVSAGACDVAETCSGTSGTCPADDFQPAATVCRESAGACDVAETCTGTSGTCPANGFQPATASCTGTSNGGACDGADHCSGTADTCVDVFQGAGTTCRASAGACDVAETCTGTSGTCPADGFQPATASCTGTSNGGACDGTDHCSGTGNTCIDVFQSAATICRASAGTCDVAETCSGTSGSCPVNGFQPATATCSGTSNGGVCDGADHCSGTANTCVDVFQSAATVCRASAGQCDVAETCTGTSGACPANGFRPATASCTGSSIGQLCDGADHCSGTANTCVDVFLPAATICRASAGQCDVAETCTGTTGRCPINGFQPATTSCTGPSTGGACDGLDHCSGTSNSCIEGFQPSTVTCRASTGQCDPAESCLGTSGTCPADAFTPNGTTCDDHDACTTADVCASGTCAGGPAPNCDDANVCTVDNCDTVLGCTHANVADGTACSDENACTLQDICLDGECVGGNGPTTDPGCVLDTVGADDSVGQKDLTQFCQNTASTCSGTVLTWQWDDTGWSGNNTGDACALYDTDDDGFANYALCVTVGKTPAVQQSGSPRLYLCTDGKAFNCTGSTLVTGSQSACVVNTLVTDPFAASNRAANRCDGPTCLTRDTQAQCCVKPADFPYPAELIDVCSYPSQSPSSDPSECVKTVFCTNDNDCVVQNGEGNCQGHCVSVGGVTQCVYTP